jgi:hypothetical protein
MQNPTFNSEKICTPDKECPILQQVSLFLILKFV